MPPRRKREPVTKASPTTRRSSTGIKKMKFAVTEKQKIVTALNAAIGAGAGSNTQTSGWVLVPVIPQLLELIASYAMPFTALVQTTKLVPVTTRTTTAQGEGGVPVVENGAEFDCIGCTIDNVCMLAYGVSANRFGKLSLATGKLALV